MFAFLFLLTENKLNREELARIQELAAGFGALVAKELQGQNEHAYDGGREDDQLSAADMDAGDNVVENEVVVSYLEDCFRLQ